MGIEAETGIITAGILLVLSVLGGVNQQEHREAKEWLEDHAGLPAYSEWWGKYCKERPVLQKYLGYWGRNKAYVTHFDLRGRQL